MQLQPILQLLGIIVLLISAAMLLPASVDFFDSNIDWQAFVGSAIACGFVGGLLQLASSSQKPALLGIREGFLFTTLAWVVVAVVSAVPFLGLGLSYTDAFFEAMSGITTTGSTVLVGLDNLPRGILLWRSILHGLGGFGIVVMAIILLPFLRIGGMQLFHMESSDKSEKLVPRFEQLVLLIAQVYLVLILACTLVYFQLGMTLFDAINHALSTVSTGGFSTHDASFAHFKSPAIEWVGILFMMLGAMPLVLIVKALTGSPLAFFSDAQVRGFVVFCLLAGFVLAVLLVINQNLEFTDAFRRALFNSVSIITTTGFASEDYTQWGTTAVAVFFILTFIGGCSGSTSGAIKVYRLQVVGILVRNLLLRLTSPHRIVPMSYNGVHLRDDVTFSVIAFLALYFAMVALFGAVLTFAGLDFTTAISASAQALGNVGPGLGEFVGPAGNFAAMPVAVKWILALEMLIGRLELFTFLVLLQPEFWR